MYRFATPCPCSEEQAAGSTCTHPTVLEEKQSEEPACACCSVDQCAPEPFDPISAPQASATRAVYRIVNMDCPTEEALIRKKLGTLAGITKLEFNLMQRVLVVEHALPSTAGIEAALNAIDMTPEPVEPVQTAVSVFSVYGLDCAEDENLIREKLTAMPGVFAIDCNLLQQRLQVRHAPSALPRIAEALRSLFMEFQLLSTTSGKDPVVSAAVIPWGRLIAGTIAAALSEAFELLDAWELSPFGLNLQAWQVGGVEVAAWLPLFFAVIAIASTGLGTYKKGWIALSNRNLNINALMSVAVTGAVLIGQYPEAAMVMVLFNLSEAIEALALERARKAIKNLLALAPEQATVLCPDGIWREMDSREVGLGSRVRVRPGERVALDGVIVAGGSSVNQAPITGESMPVEKKFGDTVYAGTINESDSFEFEVSAIAEDTTLARIIHAVEEAQASRAPMQRLVDQFAKYYTPAVFLVAILTGFVPPLFLGSSWGESIYTGLVLLVIGCPCALILSTPVTIVSGMAAAARHGILIKGGIFLEQGRRMKRLALDKTGTITYGRPQQTDFIVLDSIAADTSSALAASLASRSDHPVSRAIAEEARINHVRLLPLDDFAAIPGQGVTGLFRGEKWYLGNLRMVQELEISSSGLEKQIKRLEEQGKTVVVLVGPAGAQALFAVADTVKKSSIEAVAALKKLGIKTIMLTGDNKHTAKVIAGQAGVDKYQAELLPEDKLQVIAQLARHGVTGMVGDGINDAPALAQAGIGFAMAGGGTDAAIETADVALMDDDLRKIPRFIGLSRSTYAILLQNITLALGMKALFFVLAFMGLATMWMAVFADVGTSLLVVVNGLRAMRK